MESDEDERARHERAERLRKQVADLKSGRPTPPRSPRQFIADKMAEQARKHADAKQAKGRREPPDTDGDLEDTLRDDEDTDAAGQRREP